MKDFNYINRAKIVNPIFVLIFAVFCHYLRELAQFGGVSRRLPIIILTFSILVIWLLFHLYKRLTQSFSGGIYPEADSIHRKIKISKYWFFTAISVITLLTGVTGYRIYQSAIPYNGKLSWYIGDFFTQKEVPFEQNNIFEHGLEGLIKDLNAEVTLPKELYVSNAFKLSYSVDGEIIQLEGFLYGLNEDGETDSFLLSYDASKNNEIELRLDGYVEDTYNPHKKFQPFIDGIRVNDLSFNTDFVKIESANLYYDGFREISRDDGLSFYYDEMGEPQTAFHNKQPLNYRGYMFTRKLNYPDGFEVSEQQNFSLNYVFYDEEVIAEQIAEIEKVEAQEADPNYFEADLISEEFYLTDQKGYQLVILDAALGSRFYGLRETNDGGENWLLTSEDPFQGQTGSSAGLSFITEQLGFAVLAKSGGSYATLFRTIDGGQNFDPIELTSPTVTQNDFSYEPFDFPSVPYEKDGRLYLEVGQGADGDYNRGIQALYESTDNGETFEFVEELDSP